MRTCARCKVDKDLTTDFPLTKNKKGERKHGYWCKPCMSQYRRDYLAANRERMHVTQRSSYLKKKYGLTSADYELMLLEQDGRCAACGSRETGWAHRVFHVDHDHVTGDVRSLLCNGCNVALGSVGDNVDRLLMLVTYLRSHSG